MSMVEITVSGRRHQVQCGDGEEPRLRRLAAYIDSCVSKLVQQHGQQPEAKVLLLTSLLIADELSDAYEEIKRLKARAGELERRAEDEAAQALDRVAGRLEQLAAGLENA
ncbi:MAG: cell division protein ZapA [Geminicoccaceae bacterium]|jgi:cell division protein ZapA